MAGQLGTTIAKVARQAFPAPGCEEVEGARQLFGELLDALCWTYGGDLRHEAQSALDRELSRHPETLKSPRSCPSQRAGEITEALFSGLLHVLQKLSAIENPTGCIAVLGEAVQTILHSDSQNVPEHREDHHCEFDLQHRRAFVVLSTLFKPLLAQKSSKVNSWQQVILPVAFDAVDLGKDKALWNVSICSPSDVALFTASCAVGEKMRPAIREALQALARCGASPVVAEFSCSFLARRQTARDLSSLPADIQHVLVPDDAPARERYVD